MPEALPPGLRLESPARLRPLDLVVVGDHWGIVVAWDEVLTEDGEAPASVAAAAPWYFADHGRPTDAVSVPYEVVFPAEQERQEYDSRLDGLPRRVQNPQELTEALVQALGRAEVPGGAPVRCGRDAIERSVAPATWRLLTWLERFGFLLRGGQYEMVRQRLEPFVALAVSGYKAVRDGRAARLRGVLADAEAEPHPLYRALASCLRADAGLEPGDR